jgi:hypothetical protein
LASSLHALCNIAAGKISPGILYDNDGLIVHKGMDGGDIAQREGWVGQLTPLESTRPFVGYQRPEVGANPQLPELYDPIIRRYLE